jgi:hypothetical protein
MNFNSENINENPFSVPEGYFDNLAQRMIDNLPAHEVRMIPTEEKKKSRNRLFQWARYGAAAAVVAALCMAGMHFINKEPTAQTQVAASTTASYSTDENIDAMADYIMADDQDLYAYISGE